MTKGRWCEPSAFSLTILSKNSPASIGGGSMSPICYRHYRLLVTKSCRKAPAFRYGECQKKYRCNHWRSYSGVFRILPFDFIAQILYHISPGWSTPRIQFFLISGFRFCKRGWRVILPRYAFYFHFSKATNPS